MTEVMDRALLKFRPHENPPVEHRSPWHEQQAIAALDPAESI
jgi:hypothetical protein